jgi:hypothetical protein
VGINPAGMDEMSADKPIQDEEQQACYVNPCMELLFFQSALLPNDLRTRSRESEPSVKKHQVDDMLHERVFPGARCSMRVHIQLLTNFLSMAGLGNQFRNGFAKDLPVEIYETG